MNITHDELVELGRQWLSNRSPIVITEIAACSESPDVLGFACSYRKEIKGRAHYNSGSILIECKASRSDFYADKKKFFRRYPEHGLGCFRYFLTPKGLINSTELPEKWGLMETTGKQIRVVKIAEAQEFSERNEITVLVSAIRRLRIPEGEHCSIRAYQYETKNRATITQNTKIEEEPETPQAHRELIGERG